LGTIADEISNQMKTGQKKAERSIDDMQKQMQLSDEAMSRAGMVVAGVMVVGLALGVGWIIYQRTRRRSLVKRLQDAIPDAVRDLPDEFRAQVKRPLERAVKAL
jgi:sensor c-di-GMP phosphodiesterase-like protein